MLIGYARVSKADGSRSLDLQYDALRAAGVEQDNIYEDRASGSRDDRPGLATCLKSLRNGDVLGAGGNAAISFVACMIAVWIGVVGGQLFNQLRP